MIWQCETADLEALALRLQDFVDDGGKRLASGPHRGSIGSNDDKQWIIETSCTSTCTIPIFEGQLPLIGP